MHEDFETALQSIKKFDELTRRIPNRSKAISIKPYTSDMLEELKNHFPYLCFEAGEIQEDGSCSVKITNNI